ncbi:MAG: hypothetical protein AAGE52_00415 [Myxococcota bacterium]
MLVFIASLLACDSNAPTEADAASGSDAASNDAPDAASEDAAPDDAAPLDAAQDAAPEDAAPDVTGPWVFVSSEVLSGDSVPRANETCTRLGAELGGEWIAWISTRERDAVDSVRGEGPWYRTDGMMAFESREELRVGPRVPISFDENGDELGDVEVFTGTNPDGRYSGVDCRRWRSYYPEDDGTVGRCAEAGDGWTASASAPCDPPRRVYCFQVTP